VFDGVFDGANGKKETLAFCNAMAAWHRKGQSGRTFRVYTQSATWFNSSLNTALQSPTATNGPRNSRELEAANGTLLLVPTPFWQLVSPTLNFGSVHQLIPALFMEHAVTNSKFLAD
jgi:hypothetical protein